MQFLHLLPPSKRPPIPWVEIKHLRPSQLRAYNPAQRIQMEDGSIITAKEAVALKVAMNRNECQ